MRTAAVILAAGASSRFGSAKQLARIGPETMLAAVVKIARDAGLHPIIAVVPPGLPVPSDAVPEINDDPAAGLSRSLRLGLAAVPPEGSDAAVVLLGDQPTLDPGVVRRLLEEGDGAPVAAAWAEGRIGPPVLLRRSAFGLADDADGDEGLRRVLDAHPEAVVKVPVGAHAPDVDVPGDLDRIAPVCPGCGARFLGAPTTGAHPYIGASDGCWLAFSEVLAREFGDPAYGRVHRHSVDAYAAQHPGSDDRRERPSVALHLIGLCHWLEHDIPVHYLNAITQRLASADRAWPWLDPPSRYSVTVLDVIEAASGEEHVATVRAWATSVWTAWSAHHDLVRRWAADALG
jgi:CTP:molybdopterin cytidylyltransferase MocA